MKPIDNENNYKPMWPEIKKIVIEHIGKYFDSDVAELAHLVIDFNDKDLLNSRKKRDMLMDTVVILLYELIQVKKDNDNLKCKIEDPKRNCEDEIWKNKNLNKKFNHKYDMFIFEKNKLNDAVNELTKMNISLKSQNSDLSRKLKDTEAQNIILKDNLKKKEEDYKKLQHSEKYYKDSFLDMEKKYYRLQKKLNEYISKINDSHTVSPVTSDNDKKNVYTESQVQAPQDNISPHNPMNPSFIHSLVDFEIKMEGLKKFEKIEYPDLFKKLIKCIWDHRKNEIFSIKDLRVNYGFNKISKMTMHHYIDIFLEVSVIERIGKGFYQVTF